MKPGDVPHQLVTGTAEEACFTYHAGHEHRSGLADLCRLAWSWSLAASPTSW